MVGSSPISAAPAGSSAIVAGAAKFRAGAAERRRDRRSAKPPGEGRGGLSTALLATFVGLLLIHALRPGDAFAGSDAGPGTLPPAGDADGAAAGGTAPGADATAMAGLASAGWGGSAAATGSVLVAGSLIDPTALTRLSGGGTFGDAGAVVRVAGEGAGGASALAEGTAPAEVTAAPVALTLGAAPEVPAVADAETPAEEPTDDPGPIGEFEEDGAGDGAITGTDAQDVLRGTAGADVLAGLGGDDRLDGGEGDDRLDGGAGRDSLLGGAGADRLAGGADDDRLEGGAGDDALEGGAGSDTLLGDAGNDRLDGGASNDVMRGGAGDDTYVVDSPFDLADEAEGTPDVNPLAGPNDMLVVSDAYAANLRENFPLKSPDGTATFTLGGPDIATFPSGVAAYRAQVDPGIEAIRLEGDAGHDVVAGAGADRIEGNAGDNLLYAGAGDDRVEGGGGADRLVGQAGDDYLAGGFGDDLLDGGAGDDWLAGGEGEDLLYGGAGDDTFLLLGLAEGGATVFDHEGRNTLKLDEDADASLLSARLSGADLELLHDGRRIATVDGWAEHQDAFAGIDLGAAGGGLRSLESLLPGTETAQATAADQRDWLADFMGTEATDTPAGVSGPVAAASDVIAQTASAGAPPAAVPPWIPGTLDHGFPVDAGEESEGWQGRGEEQR